MFVGASLSGVVTNHYSFPQVEPARVQRVVNTDAWTPGNLVHWEQAGNNIYGRIQSIVRDGSTVAAGSQNLVGTTNNPVAAIEVFQKQPDGTYAVTSQLAAQPLAALGRPLSLWDKIWLWPGLGALAVMVAFALLFRERIEPARNPMKRPSDTKSNRRDFLAS